MKNSKTKDVLQNIINNYYTEGTLNIKSTPTYIEPSQSSFDLIDHLNIPSSGRNLNEMITILTNDVFPYRLVGEHPRSFAFIPAPVEDVSKIGDIITTLYNPNAAGWFSAPIIAKIHKTLIDWFCSKVGYDNKSGGVFVSGGSLANLTAIIAARDEKLDIEQINKGVAYVSEQAHHSVNKGLRMVGIPDSRIRKVPIDQNLKMIPSSLNKMIQEDTYKGLIPFITIATAGTTNSGTIDPIQEISQVCTTNNLWLHVDGAFGASVLLSNDNSHLLDGIKYADSVIWDAHKWLYQTYTCALVLVKNKNSLLKSFSDDPSYLKDAHQNDQVDSWDLGPELSRPALGIKLWLTLQTLGTKQIGKQIDYSIDMAEFLEKELQNYNHWKIITPAQLAIINFRYSDKSKTEEELNNITVRIANDIQDSGWANILTTEINNKKVIRICTLSNETTKEDMLEVVDKLNTTVKSILS